MSEENSNFKEQKEKIITVMNTMFDYLGLSATLRVEDESSRIGVKITSDDAGRIIGRKGQTLESLQLLVNRIMFKDDENCPRIALDIDGYSRGSRFEREGGEGERGERSERSDRSDRAPREHRDRRRGRDCEDREDREGGERMSKEMLEQQALDAAKEVKRWGESVTMPEMNAHDRRIIHVTLQADEEVVTESVGDGAYKKVVVSLKKD